MSLTAEIKDDIDRSFERLIENSTVENIDETVARAEDYLEEHFSKEYSDSIIEGLERGRNLIKKIDSVADEKSRQIILAALEYLIDPWDIIPDFIAEKGLLDDIYVIDQAFIRLKTASEKGEIKSEIQELKLNPDKVVQELAEAGHHLSLRAYKLNLLNRYQRTALHDITRYYKNDYHLSRKQKVFFTVIIEKLIEEGILDKSCPDKPCGQCQRLGEVYKEYSN